MNRIDTVFSVTDCNFHTFPTEDKHTNVRPSNGVLRLLLLFSVLFSIIVFSLSNNTNPRALSKQGKVYHAHSTRYTPSSSHTAVPGLTPQSLWQLYHLPGINGGQGQT